ncbi:acetyltransferase [Vibrio scophthalmi]|uniref:N-acetyltransferase domain-containing protein n=1 Tax=Vibrio scophthalmi TaxID=45658 RepID=A0A1E3WFI1_9VIBR|nr:acetyltransferase [Vibrio scophthalmi]ODS04282.1 hypothetical protein VSF3289_03413 [Vibrio scophthalmi]
MENLVIQKFSDINLDDPFFDTLKNDYKEFGDWFKRKANNNALVLYNDDKLIEGFLYCKYESGPGDDTTPPLPDTQHMKVGTFKFNPKRTRRGDRYLKKIFDYALAYQPDVDDIYVTVFGDKHPYLVELFKRYGFNKVAEKSTKNGIEDVLLRKLTEFSGDVDKDYPFIKTKGNNKYLLSIYPHFHTKLFPDSKLITDSPNIVRDISYSNSIHKIYICGMADVMNFKRGDALVIYRTGDGQGAAEFRAVATSICVVENVHTIDSYKNEEDFISYCLKFSLFDEGELRIIYRQRKYPYIINFTYNVALPKRPIRQKLADFAGLSRDDYWGVLQLTDKQFNEIIKLSELDRKLII